MGQISVSGTLGLYSGTAWLDWCCVTRACNVHRTTEKLQTLNNTAVGSLKPKHEPATEKHCPQETLTSEMSIPSSPCPQARRDEKSQILHAAHLSYASASLQLLSKSRKHLALLLGHYLICRADN